MKFFKIFTIFVAICRLAFAQESSSKDILAEVEKTTLARWHYPDAAVEKKLISWEKNEAFRKLEKMVRANWESDLETAGGIGENEYQQAIYFKAAHSMSSSEYLEFVSKVADEVKKGRIDKKQLKWSLFSRPKHLRRVFSGNPPTEKMKQVANKIVDVFSEDDPAVSAIFAKVETGQLAKEYEEWEKYGEGSGIGERNNRKIIQDESTVEDPILPKKEDNIYVIIGLLLSLGALICGGAWWLYRSMR
ncbi:MAG: hypothetical protein QM627_12835 [Luteolibacter sp.]